MIKEGNWGNNILPRLSEVNDVFQSPIIQGALTSVVGAGYVMHPHRHCNYTFPGRKVQGWHKARSMWAECEFTFTKTTRVRLQRVALSSACAPAQITMRGTMSASCKT